jgi:hypothetical protein
MKQLRTLLLVLALPTIVAETTLFAQPKPATDAFRLSRRNGLSTEKDDELSNCDEEEGIDFEPSSPETLQQLQRYAARLDRSKKRLDEERSNVDARARLVKEAIGFQKKALELTEQIEKAGHSKARWASTDPPIHPDPPFVANPPSAQNR